MCVAYNLGDVTIMYPYVMYFGPGIKAPTLWLVDDHYTFWATHVFSIQGG